MTKTEREALEALRERATQGEWTANGQRVESIAAVAFCSDGFSYGDHGNQRITEREARQNAALIVAAVNALPALLADSERTERLERVATAARALAWNGIDHQQRGSRCRIGTEFYDRADCPICRLRAALDEVKP